MDPNEIARALRGDIDRAHAFIDAMEDGHAKTDAQRLIAVAHDRLNDLAAHMHAHGLIALDGTNKPPPGP